MNSNDPHGLNAMFGTPESKPITTPTSRVEALFHSGTGYKWSEVLELAKQLATELEQAQKDWKQEKIWKNEDPQMLREQIRVADVAFQEVFDANKRANELIGNQAQENDKINAGLNADRDNLHAEMYAQKQRAERAEGELAKIQKV